MRFMKIAISSIVVILLLQACSLVTSRRVFDPWLLKKAPSTIHGRITDCFGNPVVDATAKLYLRKSDRLHQRSPSYGTAADNNGEYTMKNVKPGIDYILAVEANGFFTVIRDPVRIQPGKAYAVDIALFEKEQEVLDNSLADNDPPVIHGRVLDSQGDPVIGATVELYLSKSDYYHHRYGLYGTATDINGEFTIKDVKPDNNYFLAIEAITYFSVIRDPVPIQSGKTYHLNIVLFDTGQEIFV